MSGHRYRVSDPPTKDERDRARAIYTRLQRGEKGTPWWRDHVEADFCVRVALGVARQLGIAVTDIRETRRTREREVAWIERIDRTVSNALGIEHVGEVEKREEGRRVSDEHGTSVGSDS